MRYRWWGVMLMVAVLLVLAGATRGAAAELDEWGNALYPSQQGAPPGYPGCFADKDKEGKPLYPKWGHPMPQNYPGSLEHYGTMNMKYLPRFNPYDQVTLVRKALAVELPGVDRARIEDYAEPIYYMPMYGTARDTGRKNAPVKVLRFTKDSKPLTFTIGKLPQGMYAVRIVAVIETKDCAPSPKPLVIQCSINSGPNGAAETWIRRHRAVDEFYCVGVWFFHAWDDRAFTATLTLLPETQVDLLIHTVDCHNVLGGIPNRAVKTRPTLYDVKQRASLRKEFDEKCRIGDAEYFDTLSKKWFGRAPRRGGAWDGKARAPEERAARDEMLWRSFPPANVQHGMMYGTYDKAKIDTKQVGTWRTGRYNPEWQFTDKELKLSYSIDDLLHNRPLPDPYPYKDRGWGLLLKDKGGYYAPIADAVYAQRRYNYLMPLDGGDGEETPGQLPLEYYFRGNLTAARDAAFMLCRVAYEVPGLVWRHSFQQVVCRPDQCWGREPILRRQFTSYPPYRMLALVYTYDMLFDFIQGNQELASALGRHIPWVKTPADVIRLLDTHLVMYAGRELVNHRFGNSVSRPVSGIELATVLGDREVSRPIMEYLFSRTWIYPLPVSGAQDYMITGVTRDGSTMIGSYFYTAGGTPFLRTVSSIDRYIAAGGDPKYNLADFRRFPKALFAAYFNLDVRVAGLWPPGVGDVGGPVGPYGKWFGSMESATRIGWKYLKDPKLAYVLKNYFGRADEGDAEWRVIEKAADQVKRNPWMANRSRVLAHWDGILESGTAQDDYRFRRAATVRVGYGWGHSHRDTLDLQVYALGAMMSGDGGQRPGYGNPECQASMNHNVVEVDGDGGRHTGNWEGHAWVRTLADLPGGPMMEAQADPPMNMQQVRLAQRTVALVDVDEGRCSSRLPSAMDLGPNTVYDRNVLLPASYVLDVYRVAGGKRHTYCFHGCSEDAFTVNALNARKVPLGDAKEAQGDADAAYLRKYVLPGYQGAGKAPATVVATWQLGREPFEFEVRKKTSFHGSKYRAAAPEQTIYGKNYDSASPRKFTRLHLLDQAGARVLWGRWVSAPYTGPYGSWFTQLHVVHDGDKDLESVFAAVIEPYAGRPFIRGVRSIPVDGNEKDARRAVAVEVQTVNGHTDVLFSDGRPERARQVSLGARGRMGVSGHYACVSTDASGLRLCGLVGGRELSVPGLVAIRPARPEYRGTITRVDHYDRRFTVEGTLPDKLIDHSFLDVGNDRHRTSLEILDVSAVKGRDQSLVKFRKGLELVQTRVTGVDTQKGVVTGRLVSLLMGSDEDNGIKPGMNDGLWASNENLTKWWKCTYLGGTRQGGYFYKLSGAPVTAKDFPINGAIRIWELGATDDMRLQTFVSIRRHPIDAGVYELTANVACTVALPVAGAAAGYACSTDRVTWTKLPAQKVGALWQIDLDEKTLGDGRLFVRAAE